MVPSSPEPFPEKRRVACDNCKRAKHKCVVDDTKYTCQRCAARNEECTYKTKSAHLELDVLSELSSVISHVSEISRAFNRLVHQLSDKGLCTLDALPIYADRAESASSARGCKRSLENGSESPRKALRGDCQGDSKFSSTGGDMQKPGFSFGLIESPLGSTEAVQLGPGSEPVSGTAMSHQRAWPEHETVVAPSGPDTSTQQIGDPLRMIDFVVSNGNSTRGASSLSSNRIGDADPRQNVVKKGMIDGAAAQQLVETAHQHLIGSLYGFHLRFGDFPYVPEGPTCMTPFILSVLCSVGSERSKRHHALSRPLAQEISDLLARSPADSLFWQIAQNGMGPEESPRNDEDDIDLEMGIGPEEVLGACVLSSFSEDPSRATELGLLAFRWARGWIKWTSSTAALPFTLGEMCGTLPVKRQATKKQMSRIWLLCYITAGVAMLQSDEQDALSFDPISRCAALECPVQSPERYLPGDQLLIASANLVQTLHRWRALRTEVLTKSSSPQGELSRIATVTDASIETWRLESLPKQYQHFVPEINNLAAFGSLVVNFTTAQDLAVAPRLADLRWLYAQEAATRLLQNSTLRLDWSYVSLSHLRMITFAAHCMKLARGHPAASADHRTVVPFLSRISWGLAQTEMAPGHVIRQIGTELGTLAEELRLVS